MRSTANPLKPAPVGMRADKWLWSVRLFKTRALAAAACQAGEVKIGVHPVKPGRDVRGGEVLEVRLGMLRRTVKVIGTPPQRVGAKLVEEYLEDLTPAAEYLRVAELEQSQRSQRPKGLGRPTKKERRDLGKVFGGNEN